MSPDSASPGVTAGHTGLPQAAGPPPSRQETMKPTPGLCPTCRASASRHPHRSLTQEAGPLLATGLPPCMGLQRAFPVPCLLLLLRRDICGGLYSPSLSPCVSWFLNPPFRLGHQSSDLPIVHGAGLCAGGARGGVLQVLWEAVVMFQISIALAFLGEDNGHFLSPM